MPTRAAGPSADSVNSLRITIIQNEPIQRVWCLWKDTQTSRLFANALSCPSQVGRPSQARRCRSRLLGSRALMKESDRERTNPAIAGSRPQIESSACPLFPL